MQKYLLTLNILLILVLLSIAMPTAAARNAPVGERINLLWPGDNFPQAGAAFHIRHGWVQFSTDEAIGIFDFKLEVDGALLNEDIKMFYPSSGDPDQLWRFWVYNFPEGMTGTHTFTGHWYTPCQYAVNNLGYPGPCATPNEKVETNTRTLTVTFGP